MDKKPKRRSVKPKVFYSGAKRAPSTVMNIEATEMVK